MAADADTTASQLADLTKQFGDMKTEVSKLAAGQSDTEQIDTIQKSVSQLQDALKSLNSEVAETTKTLTTAVGEVRNSSAFTADVSSGVLKLGLDGFRHVTKSFYHKSLSSFLSF